LTVGVINTGAPGDTAQVGSLGGGSNAINIATTEDLGGGMRAGTNFQIRFNSATGDRGSFGNGNTLFHEANVFVASGMGTLRVGKIAEANICAFDPWGCTGGASTIAGASGTIGANGAGLIGAQAVQNAFSLATPVINGFSGSYMTSLSPAAGATGSAAATGSQLIGRTNERTSFTLAYAKGPLSARYLRTTGSNNTAPDYPSLNRGATAATNGAMSDADATGTAIAASYNFGAALVNVTNSLTKNAAGAKTADITTISASVPMGATTLLAGYSKDAVKAANADTRFAVGVNYALSKRTTLGADIFKQEGMAAVAGTGATGAAGNGFVIRARHTF
jgi:hypothetical protein